MQCFDVAQRNKLIPLPNVIRDIVSAFLSHDLIPLRVVEVKGDVLMIDNNNIYSRQGNDLYKNNRFIYSQDDCYMWYVIPVIGDWILVNRVLYHTSTKEFR